MSNKYDIEGFEKYFPNIVETAQIVEDCIKQANQHIALIAPVKSGKRRLTQCLAERNNVHTIKNKRIEHIFTTKLDKRDTMCQLDEMKQYGIHVHKIQKKDDVEKLVNHSKKLLKDSCVWIHVDESDYGTEVEQLLHKFFEEFFEHDNCRFIFYSATNEELGYSEFPNNHPYCTVKLKVGKDYKGAEYFLSEGLAKEADYFWDFSENKITSQGKEAMDLLISDEKIFGVVRFANDQYKNMQNNKAFKQEIESYGVKIRFADQKNVFKWGNEDEASWCSYVQRKKKVLLVICQTCTRSTEVCFHDHIAFWHDYRNGNRTPYNTRIQAYLRVAHYNEVGHKIMLYAHLPTLQVAAGYKSFDDYVNETGIPISGRVSSTKPKKLYTNIQLSYLEANTIEEARKAMKKLSSKKRVSISSCSKYNEVSVADMILRKHIRGYSDQQDRVWYIDSPNPKFQDDWNRLISRYPDIIGKFVILEPSQIYTRDNVDIKSKKTVYNM